jgi:hypothetical protein
MARILTMLSRHASLGLTFAFAAATSFAQGAPAIDSRVGCIGSDTKSNRFVDSMRSASELAADRTAAALAGKPFDPCLTGRLRVVPAKTYAAIAARHPSTHTPLPALTAAQPLASANRRGPKLSLKYSYTNLNEKVPSGFLPIFITTSVSDTGKVTGLLQEDTPEPIVWVGAYANGVVTPIAQGFVTSTSTDGNYSGGGVPIETGFLQAAIYRGANVELVPKATGQFNSQIVAINNFGVAVLQTDYPDRSTFELYFRGTRIPIAPGPLVSALALGINNFGQVAGVGLLKNGDVRAFRYDPATTRVTLLAPAAKDAASIINQVDRPIADTGVVGGYSVTGNAQKVGVWGPGNQFNTFYDAPNASSDVSTVSLNNLGQVMVSNIRGADLAKTFFFPVKGISIDVDDLTDTGADGALRYTVSVNVLGWMVGETDAFVDFLVTPRIGR